MKKRKLLEIVEGTLGWPLARRIKTDEGFSSYRHNLPISRSQRDYDFKQTKEPEILRILRGHPPSACKAVTPCGPTVSVIFEIRKGK